MMRYFFILLLITIFKICYSQNENNNWLFGYKDTLYGENCGTYIWHNDSINVSFSEINTTLNFEATTAAISDTFGNLLLYTNGCSIADSTHKTIQNGMGLNPGEIHNLVCENVGYIAPNGAMFIPWPGYENKFILLHHGIYQEESGIYINGPFYYTVIDKKDGEFVVTEKNKTILDIRMESFAVVRHGNGVDWWIIVPEQNSNRYFTYLFNKEGIIEFQIQKSGIELPANFCKMSGLSCFSPDGTKYLRYNKSCGYLLFDFDRCTGLLSGCIYESVGKIVDDLTSDFAFSSDSKYIYINKLDHHRFSDIFFINKMYRVNIDKIGKLASPYYEYELPYYFRFNRFFIANDGRILVFHPYSTEKITLINNYDNTEALELEVFNLHAVNARSSPYFANFKLKKTDCDKVSIVEANQNLFSIFPNPFANISSINIPENSSFRTLKVFDLSGRIIFTMDKNFLNNESLHIDLSNFQSGIYIFEIKCTNDIYFLKGIKI